MPSPSPSPLTIGQVADRFGVNQWKIRRLFERRLLPEPGRFGAYRIFAESDLPAIEEALRKIGYLPALETAGA